MLNIQLVYLIIIQTFSNFFQSLEHCIGDFLDNCDENDDHDISFQGTNLFRAIVNTTVRRYGISIYLHTYVLFSVTRSL